MAFSAPASPACGVEAGRSMDDGIRQLRRQSLKSRPNSKPNAVVDSRCAARRLSDIRQAAKAARLNTPLESALAGGSFSTSRKRQPIGQATAGAGEACD